VITARAALEAEGSWPGVARASRASREPCGMGATGPQAPLLKEGASGPIAPRANSFLLVEVVGEPRAEPRPRFNSRTGSVYVPTSAHEWKRLIRLEVIKELIRMGGDGGVAGVQGRPWAAGFLFRLERPKSHYRQGRFAGLLRDAAPRCHLGKPDLDNLIKAAKDAVGAWDGRPALLWTDDSQVDRYVGTPRKRYCGPGEMPGLTMVAWPC